MTVPESGNGWVPEFKGQRPPFEAGNQVAVRHAAYSELVIARTAAPVADELRAELADVLQGGDEAAVQIASAAIAQAKLAHAALEDAQAERPMNRDALLRLSGDYRSWLHTADRLLGSLGLNPKSRSAIGLDIARSRAADRERIELGRLDRDELTQLKELLSKATGDASVLELEEGAS